MGEQGWAGINARPHPQGPAPTHLAARPAPIACEGSKAVQAEDAAAGPHLAVRLLCRSSTEGTGAMPAVTHSRGRGPPSLTPSFPLLVFRCPYVVSSTGAVQQAPPCVAAGNQAHLCAAACWQSAAALAASPSAGGGRRCAQAAAPLGLLSAAGLNP